MEASEEADHDRLAAQLDELKANLGDVDEALARIANNTYGICSNCGTEIPVERLKIVPTATLCLQCESTKS